MVITSAVLSFDQADRLIRNFIDSTISARHLQDLTAEIGAELTKLRDKQTKEYRDRPEIGGSDGRWRADAYTHYSVAVRCS